MPRGGAAPGWGFGGPALTQLGRSPEPSLSLTRWSLGPSPAPSPQALDVCVLDVLKQRLRRFCNVAGLDGS